MAALSDIPGWFTPLSPEPSATDYTSQEVNQFEWESQVDFAFAYYARAELEARAGGNVSWNVGVNYNTQLAKSADYQEVQALYASAGLNLQADLNALNAAPRIGLDGSAVNYLSQYITFNGQVHLPVLTMHTTGDGLVVNQDEQYYGAVTAAAGNSDMLRQIFVHRAGHCAFTPAETLTAVQELLHRMTTGSWGNVGSPTVLNAEAASLGSQFNIYAVGSTIYPTAPAFVAFQPTQFLRPFAGLKSTGP